MNDTHGFEPDESLPSDEAQHPVDRLAALDPADAPDVAERYAVELAAELEESGGTAPDPVQLQADLDDGAAPGSGVT
jgi:hypothetical protein